MKIKIQYNGSVDDSGTLKIHRRNELKTDLFNLFRKMDVIITIEKKSKKRSVLQNNYLHLLFTIFTECLNEYGNEYQMIEIKDMLKLKFLTVDVFNNETGESVGKRVKHTSELTTTELNEFIECIIRYGSEMFGFNLPYPNEQLNLHIK